MQDIHIQSRHVGGHDCFSQDLQVCLLDVDVLSKDQLITDVTNEFNGSRISEELNRPEQVMNNSVCVLNHAMPHHWQ